ncbi:pilus assembly protein TadG-related protein [Kribbella sp. NPDC004875]|uniref:pilus assembly protein TadG-related protein n=1 Tax=Kribbella sp. NPDC004875 TaxID=3364107 RepID=UPI0036C6E78E
MRNLVPSFIRPMLRMVGPDDRGAVGVLVGVLFATGVVLGMAALTVDAGSLYVERAELQNGADAGALAVAKSCASSSGCLPVNAATYANQNSKDGTSTVSSVCGNAASGGLPSCGSATGKGACPTAKTPNYVNVSTATRTTGGSSLLPPVFARALAGNGGYQGTAVHACAQAAWGPPAQSSNSLAMTLSLCAWTQATGGMTPPTFGTDVRIFVRDTPSAPKCDGSSPPGEFGWLADGGSCSASIDLTQSGYVAGSDPGKNISKPCQDALTSYVASKSPIFIPIFDTTTGSGSGAQYHLVGLAAFVLTGYANMNPLKDAVPSGMSCPKGSTTPSCIFGHFTQALMPVSSTIGTGPSFGLAVIKLAG